MTKEKALLRGLSIFIGVVIAILSLIRGNWQTGLLITVFALWVLWVAAVLLTPHIQRANRNRQLQKMKQALQKNDISQPVSFEITQLKDPTTEQLLLMHVNHRICRRNGYG